MKQFLTTALLALTAAGSLGLLVSMDRPTPDANAQGDSQEPLLRRHPQTNLLFDLPDAFSVAVEWQGYEKISTESSILLSESDVRPLGILTKAFFDPAQLNRMGRKIVSREKGELNGLECERVELSSTRDGKSSKIWANVFGDADGSCLVLGSVFEDAFEEDGDTVKNAVFNVYWDRPEKIDPFDHVDYTIDTDVLRVLKFATKDEGMVMFTFGGTVDYTQNPGRPKLEIRRVDKEVKEQEEREALVRAQLAEAPGLRDFKVDSLKEIEIDGLKGIEGWASGISEHFRDLNNNEMPVVVLQITLFDGDHYYSMSGIIAKLISKNWLQMYQAGMHSFARKKPPVVEVVPKDEETPPEPPK